MAGLPTYGSKLCSRLPEPASGSVAHPFALVTKQQEKRGYPLTVAGTAADLKRRFAQHSLFTPVS